MVISVGRETVHGEVCFKARVGLAGEEESVHAATVTEGKDGRLGFYWRLKAGERERMGLVGERGQKFEDAVLDGVRAMAAHESRETVLSVR